MRGSRIRTLFPNASVARFLGIALVVGVGLSISAALFNQARAAERHEIAAALADLADQQVELLDIQVTRSMESLHSIGSFLRARPALSAPEFDAFVADALRRQAELQALGWSPRVPAAARPDVERQLGGPIVEEQLREGFADVVPAAARDEYFPVLHIQPRAGNERAVGFDVFSDPVRRDAMAAARDAGAPAATAPLRLVQGQRRDARGFIVYLPVYAAPQTPFTADARRASLTGYASAVFKADGLLRTLAGQAAAEGVSLAVVDEPTGAALSTPTAPTAPTATPANAPAAVRRIAVAGRAWRLTLTAGPAFIAPRSPGRAWVVLAVGASLTLLIGAYLSAVLSRTAVVERRVRQRTAQLSREVAVRTRAQEAARQAELAYRSIFDNSVEGIFQTTPGGHYLRANAALARIYGYVSPEELIADLSDIAYQLYVEPGRREEFAREVRRTGTVNNFESQVYRKDGRVIWISENARAVCDAAGSVLHYEGFVVDVTARRAADDTQRRVTDELERRVRERTEALAAANAAKSRFCAAMSHEIRTPMNAILGYAQVLRRDAALPAAQRDAVAAIASSGNHLLGLIDGILDLSRIEAGHVEVQPADFDLGALADDLDRMFRQRCREKGVALAVSACRGAVRGDERKLRQVLINLTANAVRFTDAGDVTLRVRRRAPGQFTFEIRDTGVGISATALTRIFEPFQQGHAPGGARGGTGLGLTIARQFVRLLGGDLAVTSQPGAGSCFSFSLPLDESTRADDDPARPQWDFARLAAGHAVHALVVDDVPENRRVLAALLEAAGVDVTSAATGAEALALARADAHPRTFDVALIDILMPDLDGFETAARLRALPASADVPLVATSAAVFAHDQARYEHAGFRDVLAKPIAAASLYRCIADLTGATFDLAPAPDAPPHAAWSVAAAAAEAAQAPPELVERLARAADRCSVTDLRACAQALARHGLADGHLARCLDDSLRTFDTAALAEALAPALASAAPSTATSTGGAPWT